MPLINNCYGSGSGAASQLCEQVDNFTVAAGILTAKLTWSAPTTDEDSSFVGTRIVRKVGSAPKNKSDGTVVYEGTEFAYTDTGLTEGTTYYYRAFAYNIKMAYQTAMRVVRMTAISYESNFADNTWDLIIEACHSGNVPDTWVAGDSKTMTIDGTDYQFDIVGKNHDTYTAGGTAPITFGMHDCYSGQYQMNPSNTKTGWRDSAMRTVELHAILEKMPEKIRNEIKAVDKLTSTGGVSGSLETTSDRLFLFSEMEVAGSASSAHDGEGKQYDYYKAGNSSIKKVNGKPDAWWLRSTSANYAFLIISSYGSGSTAFHNASNYNGLSFGFCF